MANARFASVTDLFTVSWYYHRLMSRAAWRIEVLEPFQRSMLAKARRRKPRMSSEIDAAINEASARFAKAVTNKRLASDQREALMSAVEKAAQIERERALRIAA